MADPDKDPVNMKGKSTDLTPWPQEWHRFHRLKMLVRVQPVSFWVYTLCSAIISSDLNGDGYIVVPLREDEENPNSLMEIGYITKKNNILSRMGEEYIEELKKYFRNLEGE